MRTGEQQAESPLLHMFHGMLGLRGFRLALAGWHFQVDAVSIVHDHLWDGTSLVLRKGIRCYAHDGQRVLDLGTGQLGLLAVYCARTHNVKMVAVDLNEEFVENTRLVAGASDAPAIDFRQSDWFSNVDGTFDLIFGNAPYVPTDMVSARQYLQPHPEIWDGGNDGLAHARTILANVGRFLRPEGLLLLGIDAAYVPRDVTLGLVEATQDLELMTIVQSWISASEVYVIGLKSHSRRDH
jgi:methylase of polypeptide subunit release factors